MIYADSSFDFGARKFRFRYLDVPKLSRKDADPSLQQAELNETLAEADYIIMSTRWYEGLVNSPEASAVIKDYYRALPGGASDFELLKR